MPVRKRKSAPAAEAPATPDPPSSRRRSGRISSSGQKSKYFEADSESEIDRNGSTPKRGRDKGRPSKKTKVEAEAESDDYQDEGNGVDQNPEDSDEEVDEDAPPKVTFIPLPKLRDTGDIAYADDRLHPNTLAFLKDLKANNKRTWLKCESLLSNMLSQF